MFVGLDSPHESYSYLVRDIYHKPELIQPLFSGTGSRDFDWGPHP